MKPSSLHICSALALLASPAAAELKYENNSGGSVRLYGQFNPAIVSVDDGQHTETNLVDNDLTNSRVGLEVLQPFGDNMFGFKFETGLSLPNSTEYDQDGHSMSDGWDRTDLRHIDFWLSGDWGKASVGQGSMASDGVAEVDLSLVGFALYAYTADANSGFLFRDHSDVLSGPRIGDTTDDFDGGRKTRFRYDTPSLAGFTLSASYGQDELADHDDADYYDVAVRYSNTFANGIELSAGLAYSERDDDGDSRDRNDVIGSASLMLQNGLSFTAATGRRDNDAHGVSDPEYYYLKVAYEADWFGFGKTGVGVHYYDGEDFFEEGSDSEVWGIGAVQRIDRWNVDAYLTYQQHSFDGDTVSYHDVDTVMLGARWAF